MSIGLLETQAASLPKDPAPRQWLPEEFASMQAGGLFENHRVRLQCGEIEEFLDGEWEPFVFTRKEYYWLYDRGYFEDQRVQLIAGVIELESPMNPPHALGLQLVAKTLEAIFGEGYAVRTQLPVDLGLISEPHPDVAVVAGSMWDYADEHPKTALLIVEVSDSTLDKDTSEKASLYAAGGIRDYWVVDLVDRQLIVYRTPQPDAEAVHGASYADRREYERSEQVTLLAKPGVSVEVAHVVP